MEKSYSTKEVALFRYGIIADFVNLPPGTKGLYALIKIKAEQDYLIPGSRRTKVAEETIRSWLKISESIKPTVNSDLRKGA